MALIKKQNWKEDHLDRKHEKNYGWCPLCIARKEGEDNPPQHLTPPQQDPSQKDLKYLKKGYRPEIEYSDKIESGDVDTTK